MNSLCTEHLRGNPADGLLRVSDAGLARFYFLQGFLATFAVLYPLFGRAFTVFGYHNRVVSTALILIVIMFSFPRFSFGRARNGLGALTLALVALACLYADSLQRGEIFHVQFETGYYEGKLARLFQISLPVCVLGYLVSTSRFRVPFVKGAWWAILVSGLIGLAVLLVYREHFLGQTSEMLRSFGEEELFSNIGLSIVLSLAMILLLERLPWKDRDFFWLPWFGLALLFAVVLLRQRGHLIMLCLFVLAKVWERRRKLASLLAAALVFGFAAAVVVRHYHDLVITETVQRYWSAAVEGQMMRSRTDLAALAIAGIRENPLGYGLGAFDLHYYKPYPHNRFLEAFYELGIGGAVCVGWMCVMGSQCLCGLFTGRHVFKAGSSVWFLHAAVVFLLAHELKAGSLECISIYLYFLFITPTVGRFAERPGQTTVPLRAGAAGMHRRPRATSPVALRSGRRTPGRPC